MADAEEDAHDERRKSAKACAAKGSNFEAG
jgi:hypothetical protein